MMRNSRYGIIIIAVAAAASACGGDGSVALITSTAPADETTTTTVSLETTTSSTIPATTTTRAATTTTEAPTAADSLYLIGLNGFMGESTWRGVVLISNSASQPMLLDSGQIIFKTESGAIVDTDYVYSLLLYPGMNYISAVLFDAAAEPAQIEMTYSNVTFLDAGRFTISNLQVVPESYRRVEVSGEIQSSFAQAHDFVQLTFVFFDSDGTALYADTGYVDLVEAGGTTLFSETIFTDDLAPAWDHIEVFALP